MKTTAIQRIQPIYGSVLGMLIYTALICLTHLSLLQLGAFMTVFALAMVVVAWEYFQHHRPVTLAVSVFIIGGVAAFSLSLSILGMTEIIFNIG